MTHISPSASIPAIVYTTAKKAKSSANSPHIAITKKTTLKTLEGNVSFKSTVTGEETYVTGGEMMTADSKGLSEIQQFDISKEDAEWENLKKKPVCFCIPALSMILSLLAAGLTRIF